jgi:hypothetical protein
MSPARKWLARAAVAALALAVLGPSLTAGRGLDPLPATAPAPRAQASNSPAASAPVASHPPVLAYYYMWFKPTSWTRAKTDLPQLGAYDSTDAAVIDQEVRWARAAGVDAFIASWKHTPGLDDALAKLVASSASHGLKLVLIYEGLDVNRNPIPVATVASDLAWFTDVYGSNPVFALYGSEPAVIWSGSWKFSSADIASVRAALNAPRRLLLLGSEKDATSYSARASLFDGDAYYWSSADPLSTPGYQARLTMLGTAVHAQGGLWLAPATSGFDARLNGGTSVVDRRNGATLTKAWMDALQTSPDGVAVISWNEFTEGSYVEPSVAYGQRYLEVLALLTGARSGPTDSGSAPSAVTTPAPTVLATSSAPPVQSATPGNAAGGAQSGPTHPAFQAWASLTVALALFLGLGALGLMWRRRERSGSGIMEPGDD